MVIIITKVKARFRLTIILFFGVLLFLALDKSKNPGKVRAADTF